VDGFISSSRDFFSEVFSLLREGRKEVILPSLRVSDLL